MQLIYTRMLIKPTVTHTFLQPRIPKLPRIQPPAAVLGHNPTPICRPTPGTNADGATQRRGIRTARTSPISREHKHVLCDDMAYIHARVAARTAAVTTNVGHNSGVRVWGRRGGSGGSGGGGRRQGRGAGMVLAGRRVRALIRQARRHAGQVHAAARRQPPPRQHRRLGASGRSCSMATGGVLSIAQQALDSYAQRDWSGISGNPVKFTLGNVSIAYDVAFMLQHYVWYPPPAHPATPARVQHDTEPLLQPDGLGWRD